MSGESRWQHAVFCHHSSIAILGNNNFLAFKAPYVTINTYSVTWEGDIMSLSGMPDSSLSGLPENYAAYEMLGRQAAERVRYEMTGSLEQLRAELAQANADCEHNYRQVQMVLEQSNKNYAAYNDAVAAWKSEKERADAAEGKLAEAREYTEELEKDARDLLRDREAYKAASAGAFAYLQACIDVLRLDSASPEIKASILRQGGVDPRVVLLGHKGGGLQHDDLAR
jgi:hypothetical protein